MTDARITAAFEAVDRQGFLPHHQHRFASHDRPLTIGWGQTNSQPSTVAAMLQLLDVQPGHRVLDIGAGSGWTTALLAHLVGPTGRVFGVELVPELATWGAGNVARSHQPWATLQIADPDVLGLPAEAPFDRILVSAMATELPEPVIDQLTPTGILVIPVSGRMVVVHRQGDAPPRITHHGLYAFVPLITRHA